ncbi:MAG: hypothetical protein AUH85_09560 [Chloroflexi bacterium 13_1_40CM_4_68_4]|nr:MAG: hypothetical protein AUH85_09560 [Chloroflexi bacterium 13_1_40CM_4_68_4]
MARYAVMWSGGKDSALALRRALRRGLEVAALLNVIDEGSRRVRFHATRAELIAAQASALDIPLRQIATSWTNFESSFRTGLAALAAEGFEGVIFGDIHLADVRAWYEDRVRAAGLEHIEPLWGEASDAVVRDFVDGGGRAVVTCVELRRLDASWLGRVIDHGFPDAIAATGVDPCGENGEYHSFAFDGPPFRSIVPWAPAATHEEQGFLQLDLADPVEVVADDTVSVNYELFDDTVAARPKAWGALAAQGVISYRARTGRPPDDVARRAIWAALWKRVEAARANRTR